MRYTSLQKGERGHSPHFGFLAVQISLPNKTIRWQKSELSSGGKIFRSCFSTFSGSFPLERPSRPQIRIQWVSQTTLPGAPKMSPNRRLAVFLPTPGSFKSSSIVPGTFPS